MLRAVGHAPRWDMHPGELLGEFFGDSGAVHAESRADCPRRCAHGSPRACAERVARTDGAITLSPGSQALDRRCLGAVGARVCYVGGIDEGADINRGDSLLMFSIVDRSTSLSLASKFFTPYVQGTIQLEPATASCSQRTRAQKSKKQ